MILPFHIPHIAPIYHRPNQSYGSRIHPGPFIFFNDSYYSIEECQLVCSLISMSADDNLVVEILKHERMSPEPVNCTGLKQFLMDHNLSVSRCHIYLPHLVGLVSARIKAQEAYSKWIDMTGIMRQSVPSFPYLLPIIEGLLSL